MSIYVEGIGNKAWQLDVYRTQRGQIIACAVEGEIEKAAQGITSFTYELFGDTRRIRIALDAKRLTAKVREAGIALLRDEVAKLGPKPAPLPEQRPAVFRLVGGPIGVEDFNNDNVVEAMAARGFCDDGKSPVTGTQLRAELRDRPQFKGLAGPMWGGTTADGLPIIRYETWAAYERMSA